MKGYASRQPHISLLLHGTAFDYLYPYGVHQNLGIGWFVMKRYLHDNHDDRYAMRTFELKRRILPTPLAGQCFPYYPCLLDSNAVSSYGSESTGPKSCIDCAARLLYKPGEASYAILQYLLVQLPRQIGKTMSQHLQKRKRALHRRLLNASKDACHQVLKNRKVGQNRHGRSSALRQDPLRCSQNLNASNTGFLFRTLTRLIGNPISFL